MSRAHVARQTRRSFLLSRDPLRSLCNRHYSKSWDRLGFYVDKEWLLRDNHRWPSVNKYNRKMSDVLKTNGNMTIYIPKTTKVSSIIEKGKKTLREQCFQRRHDLESLLFYDRSQEQVLSTLWFGSDDGVINHLQ